MDVGMIQKLIDDLNVKVEEIRPQLEKIKETYTVLEGLQKLTGTELDLPDLSWLTSSKRENLEVTKPATRSIHPDTFYGKEPTVAAELYLKDFRNARPFTEIYEALKKGGLDISKDKLDTALTRSTRRFKKFGTGDNASFGMLSWYPDKKKTSVKNEEPTEETQNEEEKMNEQEQSSNEEKTQ